ncbi:phosphocholine cytidylyltransferase family protein [bacterium]|nr:phosphocholine cytidylyltransferase family protein [bacterium]
MIAVILVAGRSTRMGDLTAEVHKSLLTVGDRPILSRLLIALDDNAIRRVIFVGGSMQEQLEDFVRTHHGNFEVSWVRNEDYATTNTAYSVMLTDEAMGRDHDMLLINGDVVLDARAIARTLNGRGAHETVSVLATRFSGVADEEVKVLVNDGRITEIGKHIDPQRAAGESVGINLIARQQLDALYSTLRNRIETGDGRSEYYEHAFNQMVTEGIHFRTADVTDLPVMEVDTPDDYSAVKQELAPRLFG